MIFRPLSFLLLGLFALSALHAEEPPATPKMTDLGDGKYTFGDISLDSNTRTVSFPGEINLTSDEDYIEYAIVHEQGATHEALISTEVMPFHLQMVLLLLDYRAWHGELFKDFTRDNGGERPEEAPEPKKDLEKPDEEDFRFTITVSWDGGEAPIETLLTGKDSGKPIAEDHWQFVGLAVGLKYYRPEAERSIAATYLDRFAPLNFAGEGNRDDEYWLPHTESLPPVGTPVTITLTPYKK